MAASVVACKYQWLDNYDSTQTIASEIKPPEGFVRSEVEPNSFAAWLRGLPLRKKGTLVRMYNGLPKYNPRVAHRVIDMNIGDKDLLQCADAAIRLRAEYLYQQGEFDRIHFNFTSGDTASFRRWINGYRPKINGNEVTWSKTAAIDSSYDSFQKYLTTVYSYAGSYSLSRELKRVSDQNQIQPGDMFIEGGFPGHVVIVVDVAQPIDTADHGRLFLLVQGFTPAQDLHVLRNGEDDNLSPWYSTDYGSVLKTPEWEFPGTASYRFR